MIGRAALALLAGCNYAFGIPTSDHPLDAAPPMIDAPAVDAGPCGTHDEDVDGFADGCDLCPMFADMTDTDGDGIGDLCDPAPADPSDHLVLFDPLVQAASDWTAVGTWTFAADHVSYSDSMLGTLHRMLSPLPLAVTAETMVTFTTNATKSAAGLDLVLATHTFRCVVLRDTVDVVELFNATSGAMLRMTTLGGGGPVQVRVGHRATGEITCTAARMNSAAVDASDTAKFTEPVIGVGFASGGIPIEIPYLAVYRSP